jgi:hypothetical protein
VGKLGKLKKSDLMKKDQRNIMAVAIMHQATEREEDVTHQDTTRETIITLLLLMIGTLLMKDILKNDIFATKIEEIILRELTMIDIGREILVTAENHTERKIMDMKGIMIAKGEDIPQIGNIMPSMANRLWRVNDMTITPQNLSEGTIQRMSRIIIEIIPAIEIILATIPLPIPEMQEIIQEILREETWTVGKNTAIAPLYR